MRTAFNNVYFMAVCFLLAGWSGLPPFLYALWKVDETCFHDVKNIFLILLVAGMVLLFGAIFYALRWPETSYPRTFDYIGCSHNIFHTLVVVGCGISYYATIKCFHLR